MSSPQKNNPSTASNIGLKNGATKLSIVSSIMYLLEHYKQNC